MTEFDIVAVEKLREFKKSYPNVTGGDMQTFALGTLAMKELISEYQNLLKLAGVPEILIEFPRFIKGLPVTESDIEWAKTKIEEYKNLHK